MTYFHPAWLEARRRRFTRPDGQRWIRPDAARFRKPAPYTQQSTALSPDDLELAAERAALLHLRSDIAALRAELKFRRMLRDSKAGFDASQPRWPAGSGRISGQWSGGAGTGGPAFDPSAKPGSPTHSDEAPENSTKPGAQYAARTPRGGNRPFAGQFPGTPRQETKFQATKVRADRAISAVQRIDPNWRPEPGFETPRDIESAIRHERDIARETEARLDVLNRLNIGPTTPARANAYAQPVEDILAPAGVRVGVQEPRAGDNITTVPPIEFVQIREQLLAGARPVPTQRNYNGLQFERSDGASFGIRWSRDHGPTIDIFRSNSRLIPKNFKVHQK